ncbi:hypothetical protein [Desertibacillus haloalkaliphilus]|uniref:hypothetical protein n=1 Tax=Desertibacillus haloalkaliphilus TaxID=1328930 RepID=UPI001C25A27A|nr:hypothetical protein [Desertibacillus haloalkaliphilus]MBU8905848.1 hypothetical protein [Desertibacillus haloalkaliphilus]
MQKGKRHKVRGHLKKGREREGVPQTVAKLFAPTAVGVVEVKQWRGKPDLGLPKTTNSHPRNGTHSPPHPTAI